MKTYVYDRMFYIIEIIITGIFCLLLAMASIFMAIKGVMPTLMIFTFLVSSYTAWNAFVSKSNPERIEVDERCISFYSFNKKVSYEIEDIEEFRIREFPTSGKMYLRINKHNILSGRFWVPTKMFNESKELFQTLIDIEYKIHPDSIKSRARTVNTKYLELKAQKKHR